MATKVTPNFIQWKDGDSIYGLNFASEEDADIFYKHLNIIHSKLNVVQINIPGSAPKITLSDKAITATQNIVTDPSLVEYESPVHNTEPFSRDSGALSVESSSLQSTSPRNMSQIQFLSPNQDTQIKSPREMTSSSNTSSPKSSIERSSDTDILGSKSPRARSRTDLVPVSSVSMIGIEVPKIDLGKARFSSMDLIVKKTDTQKFSLNSENSPFFLKEGGTKDSKKRSQTRGSTKVGRAKWSEFTRTYERSKEIQNGLDKLLPPELLTHSLIHRDPKSLNQREKVVKEMYTTEFSYGDQIRDILMVDKFLSFGPAQVTKSRFFLSRLPSLFQTR